MNLTVRFGPEEEEALESVRKKFKLGNDNDAIRFAILYTDTARWYPDIEWIGNYVMDQLSRIDRNTIDPPLGRRIPPRLRRGRVPPSKRRARRKK